MSKGVQIAIGAALVALLLGGLGWTQLQEASFTYYQNLEEFRTAAEPGAAVRVHGYVAEGSIERDVSEQVVRFRVQSEPPHASSGGGGEALSVVYANLATPDLFQDGAEVVVEGRLPAGGEAFHATNVLAKCPSKFRAEEGARPASL